MKIENLHEFLYHFFKENQCSISSSTDTQLAVQLSPEIDEQLMNRPFYWQYMKKMGLEGEASELYLTTDPNDKDEKYEFIHFGSPRLKKIMDICLQKGKYVKLYELANVNQHTPLVPWLILTIKLSYIGQTKKEEIHSIGINMINGAIINDAISFIQTIDWDIKASDFCYTLTPLIHVSHSYQRVVQLIEHKLQQQSHQWATESWVSMEKEIELLNRFYESAKSQHLNHYQEELATIEALYLPEINIDIINGGIFFITQPTTFRMFHR